MPHRTSDGCAAFLRLTLTSPQRSARTKRLYVRRIATNVSGRLTLTGRLRHRGTRTNVWLRRTTLAVVGGHPRSAWLALTSSQRRIVARRLRSGRVEIDVVSTLSATRATARVRIRAQ